MVKKFLIADDDIDDREMFCEALEAVAPGSECFSVPNGRRAMMALTEGEIGLPDIIFLDVNMPLMNGWQCLSQLKATEAYQHIPAIMYSTSSHPEDVERAQHLGALCFFTKPSDFNELKKCLALVVAHLNAGELTTLTHSSSLFLTCSS
ncbi:MAG: response regulator [Flavisolibacter sp.]